MIMPFVAQATEHAEIFTIFQPDVALNEPDPEVSWTMELVATGIKSFLEVSFEKPEEVSDVTGESGWEYQVEIDGIIVSQNFHTDANNKVEQIIPLASVTDGKHAVTLTVRDFNGKLHTQKREFELNSAPTISATFQDDKVGVFDPQITFSFLGEQDELAGMVEIFLDQLPLKSVNISGAQNNNPISLSELIGSQIYNADLTPGQHLLIITAHGLNGSSSAHVLTVIGSLMLPEIMVQHSSDGKLESLNILFPSSSKKIVGSAEVHYNGSTILAVRSEQTTLSISRADLKNALKKHNLKIGEYPATMIISTSSANQVENWQEVSFK
jgi:hypothetical protein